MTDTNQASELFELCKEVYRRHHGSYETIKRQYQQLREALYRKEAEL